MKTQLLWLFMWRMSTFIFKFSESINFMCKYTFHNLVIKKPNADFNIIYFYLQQIFTVTQMTELKIKSSTKIKNFDVAILYLFLFWSFLLLPESIEMKSCNKCLVLLWFWLYSEFYLLTPRFLWLIARFATNRIFRVSSEDNFLIRRFDNPHFRLLNYEL